MDDRAGDCGTGPAWGRFLRDLRRYQGEGPVRRHIAAYCRGLASDLPRKSVEPIALAAGSTVRSLQLLLTQHDWDNDGLIDALQRRVVELHLPAPGEVRQDPIGVVGWIDETSFAKKGNKTPGVQRQYCGSTGKTMPDSVWQTRAGRVHISVEGKCHDQAYWLIVTKNKQTGEVKYFISNAPLRTSLKRMLAAAFSRWGIEHLFRIAKGEIGLGHYEGRKYLGLMRHLALCQLTLLFIAERRSGLGGKNPQLTKEQVARALNAICARWLRRRRGTPLLSHTGASQ